MADGTSFACAVATSVVALTWANNPDKDYREILEIVSRNSVQNENISELCQSGSVVYLR